MFLNFKKICLPFMLCLLFLPPFATECPGADTPDLPKKIIVAGTGVAMADDPAKARENAISESLVAAIGIVMADMMPSDMLIQNFETLNEMMYTRKNNYVSGYRVLTELEYNRVYRVVVEAQISRSRISKELSQAGFLIGSREKPPVLFLIAEYEFEESVPHYWWGDDNPGEINTGEKAIGEAMNKLGFEITPHSIIPEINGEGLTLSTPEPDNETVLSIGRMMGAEFVIVGSAVAGHSSNTMGEKVRSFKGTVSARALRVDTGEEVAAAYRSDVSVDTDEIMGRKKALRMAGKSAGNDLALQLIKTLDENKASEVKIVVKGEGYLSNFAKFRNAIRQIPEVDNIRIQEMKPDEAILFVECRCGTEKITKALMSRTFNSFGINIVRIDKQQLAVRLVPEKARKKAPQGNAIGD